ncbi:MAG: hypothetical protein GIX03_13785, partial [Candidatus Eremiobacteraeota bacterium]|nr:hypothetical protein [Candidatus Eremiobacteraeota bacterium]
MNGGLKGLLTAAVLAAVGVGLYKLQVHGQPLPAIVPRTGDAHREVSSALDARI